MMDYFKPSLMLLLICFVVVGLVATVNDLTKDKILFLEEQEKQDNMRVVLPGTDSFETRKIQFANDNYGVTIQEISRGRKNGLNAGYIYLVQTAGYNGNITVMAGLDESGKVTGLVMGDDNKETPGLGKEAARGSFTKQFIGVEKPPLKVVKTGALSDDEIDAVSGATITSDAITRAVNAVLEYHSMEGAE